MIRFTKGNLWDAVCDGTVVTTNCVGVMGKGVALEARLRYPQTYADFRAAHRRGDLKIGEPLLWSTYLADGISVKHLIWFPTKDHWRQGSRYEWIAAGLHRLREHLESDWSFLQSLAMPPLGCGLGGLDWQVVRMQIEQCLGNTRTVVNVYEP